MSDLDIDHGMFVGFREAGKMFAGFDDRGNPQWNEALECARLWSVPKGESLQALVQSLVRRHKFLLDAAVVSFNLHEIGNARDLKIVLF